MALLTAAKRNKLPASSFAGPDRSYPVPDRSHAANAKARASQAVKAGRMSKAQEAKIDAKANKVLGEKGNKPAKKSAPPKKSKPATKMPLTSDHGMSRSQLQDHGLHTSKHFGGKGEY
jgi:hypothetical protein